MVSRILIPTDFSTASLQVVLAYLEQTDKKEVEIILACGVDLGSSITTLYSFDKEIYLEDIQGEDFIKGCQVIRAKYKNKVKEIYADLVVSKNSRYIANYLKGNQIIELVLSERYRYSQNKRLAFDLHGRLCELQQKVGSLVNKLAIPQSEKDERDELEALFFRKNIKLSYE